MSSNNEMLDLAHLLAEEFEISVATEDQLQKVIDLVRGPPSQGAATCDCGFSAEDCATNPCVRKKVHLAGMTPNSKWPNTGVPAQEAAGKPVAWRIVPEDTLFLLGATISDDETDAEKWRAAGCRVEPLGVLAEGAADSLQAEIGMLREKLSDALAGGLPHKSDCAVYNAPAEEPGPCDCGVAASFDDGAYDLARKLREHNGWERIVSDTDAVNLIKAFVASSRQSPATSAPVEEAPTSTLRAAAQALVHEIAESGTHLRWKRLSHALETEDERIAALRSPAASDVDALWEALKQVCTATPDKALVKACVMVRKPDVERAVASLRSQLATSPAASASDIERAFTDVCDELGCKYDNEAALEAIDALKRRSQPDSANEEPRG
jgi:hypothetical protein